MIASKHLAQTNSTIKGVSVFGSARDAQAAARPEAKLPGFAGEGPGIPGRGGGSEKEQKQNRTTEARRRGERRPARRHRNLQGIRDRRDYQVAGKTKRRSQRTAYQN